MVDFFYQSVYNNFGMWCGQNEKEENKVKYLAFDLEAANGYKLYSVCSFGYCLADENFNIVKKENIWINPRCKYNLNGTRKNVGLDLHLDKDVLDNSPDFPHVYDRIKALLTDPQVIVIGHAVESDVNMINKTCQHYKLPSINYKFYCSQLFFRLFKGEKDVRSLGKIAEEIGITFNAHTSDEDAYASLMTLKYLVETTGKTLEQLAETYQVRVGSNDDFVMTRTVSLAGQVSKRYVTRQSVIRITDYIAKQHTRPVSDGLKGKLFCLSRSIELADASIWVPLIDFIYLNGGQYTTKPGKCDYYVVPDGEEVVYAEVARLKYVDTQISAGKPITKIRLSEVYELK